MTKEERQHFIFGGAILAVGLVILYKFGSGGNSAAPATASPTEPLPVQPSGETIAAYPAAQAGTPGASSINIGGSPVYLTYNMPQSQSYLPGPELAPPVALTGPGSPSQGSACGCACNNSSDLTQGQVTSSLAPGANFGYSNLAATGLLAQSASSSAAVGEFSELE